MAKRGITEQQRTWLVSELNEWESHGFVSSGQAAPILDLYETHAESVERKRSTALLLLMGIAAFLVGLGVLLLVGYNWGAMPDVLKLLILFGVTFGTQGLGFFLRLI